MVPLPEQISGETNEYPSITRSCGCTSHGRRDQVSRGIVIPDSAAEKPSQGEVIAVGPGKKLDNGAVQEVDLKVGDKILFGQYAGSTVKLDNEELLIMNESEVFGVVE